MLTRCWQFFTIFRWLLIQSTASDNSKMSESISLQPISLFTVSMRMIHGESQLRLRMRSESSNSQTFFLFFSENHIFCEFEPTVQAQNLRFNWVSHLLLLVCVFVCVSGGCLSMRRPIRCGTQLLNPQWWPRWKVLESTMIKLWMSQTMSLQHRYEHRDGKTKRWLTI